MGQRWICMNGHGTGAAPPRMRCPVCAAAMKPVVPVGTPAGADHELEQTLVPGPAPGPDSPATLATPTTNGLGHAGPARPPSDIEVTLQPEGPTRLPAADDGPLETLMPPSPLPPTGRPPQSATALAGHDGATLVPPSEPRSGQAGGHGVGVPDYEVIEVLGRGGMGVVYKARQTKLNRIVALKMILAGQYASDEELRRFQTEAEAVARLQHPNIVQIFDHGERDGRPYFALEYCGGGSLQARLDGTPMTPPAAARLLRTLAEAVHHAHKNGIVHRDMKPANILLAEGPDIPLDRCTPKITDFGLAKRLEDDQGHTATEAILGTPTYMAPEQAGGDTKKVGPAADVYALGAILYDLLTGRPPFKGATALDTIQMVRTAEPVPPVRLQPGIPGDLQTITLKCLEKAPERRYSSAGELARDLTRFLAGEPIRAWPASSWERGWKWVRRHPAVAALIAVCFLAPTAIAAVSIGFSVQLKAEADRALKAEKDADEKRGRAEKAEKEARDSLAEVEKAKKEEEAAKVKAMAAEDEARKAEAHSNENFRRAQLAAERLLRLAQDRLRKMGGTEAVRRELLDEALEMSRSFTRRQGDSAANLRRAVHAHRLVGELEAQLGRHADAVAQFNEALAAHALLAGKSEGHRLDPAFQNEAAEILMQRWAAEEAVSPGSSIKSLKEALSRIAAMPEAVRPHWTTERSRAAVLSTRAIHHQSRGTGRLASARKDLTDSLGVLEGLAKRPEASDPGRRDDIALERARVLANLSALDAGMAGVVRDAAAKKRHLDDALAEADAALKLLGGLRERSSAVEVLSELGRAAGNKGLVLLARGENDAAAKVFDGAVAEFREVRKLAPLNADYRELLAVALVSQGLGRYQMKRYEQAEEPLREAAGLFGQLAKDFPAAALYRQGLARANNTLGLCLMGQGRPAAAIEHMEKARAGFTEAASKRGQESADAWLAWGNLVRCHHLLAAAAGAAGKTEKALVHLTELSVLRKQRLEALPAVEGDWARLAERLLAGSELLMTESVRARLLERAGDHRALSACVAAMARLAPTWPGHQESLAHLAACVRLAEADKEIGPELRKKIVERYRRQAAELERLLAPRRK